MYDNFWPTDIIELYDRDSLYYTKTYRRLEIIFYGLCASGVATIISTLVASFISDDIQLPLRSYEPPFVNFATLFVFQVITAILGSLIPTMPFISLIMSLTKLTELQFRALNSYARMMFRPGCQSDVKARIKIFVKHHNFLLRWGDWATAKSD